MTVVAGLPSGPFPAVAVTVRGAALQLVKPAKFERFCNSASTFVQAPVASEADAVFCEQYSPAMRVAFSTEIRA